GRLLGTSNLIESDKLKCVFATEAARVISTYHSYEEGLSLVKDIEPRLGTLDDAEMRIRALHRLGHIKYEAGLLYEAKSVFNAAMREADSIGAVSLWPPSAAHTHMLNVELGLYTEAGEVEAEVRKRIRAIEGGGYLVAQIATNNCMMHFDQNDHAKALASATEARAITEAFNVYKTNFIAAFEGLIHLERGHHSKADSIYNWILSASKNIHHGDVSYIEILKARLTMHRGDRIAAVDDLRKTINQYQTRDKVCLLRMQLELSRLLKGSSRHEARKLAKEVYETARSIGARPIAERADSLLLRI